MNQDKLFLKVPINISCKASSYKLYVAYLWFKKIDRSGVFEKPSSDRNKTYYWLKKLTSAGWATFDGKYHLKPYQEIWRLMGTKHVKKVKSGFYRYKYFKLPNYYKDYDITKFFKTVLFDIQGSIVEAKKRQLRYRLSLGEGNTIHYKKPEFSCISMAKLLGYSTWTATTGAKYRSKFFKVEQSYGLIKRLSPKNLLSFSYPCGKISLA